MVMWCACVCVDAWLVTVPFRCWPQAFGYVRPPPLPCVGLEVRSGHVRSPSVSRVGLVSNCSLVMMLESLILKRESLILKRRRPSCRYTHYDFISSLRVWTSQLFPYLVNASSLHASRYFVEF